MFSRRRFLGASAGAAGLVALGNLGRRAHAQTAERTAILTVWTGGQYPALLSATDAMVGNYGVTDADVETIGNGLCIDRTTLGTFSPFAKSHMACIGVYHGVTDHYAGTNVVQTGQKGLYLTELAAAIGGNGPLKATYIGVEEDDPARTPAVAGVAPQKIPSMTGLCELLGMPTANPAPNYSRPIGSALLNRAQAFSKPQTQANPLSIASIAHSYGPAASALSAVSPQVTYAELNQAYGLNNHSTIYRGDLAAKIATAELAIRAGANTAFVSVNMAWDTHAGGGTGIQERENFTRMMPPVRTFCNRMLEVAGLNMIVILMAEFSHEKTSHNPCLSATVIGKYVKSGTTGRPPKNNAILPRDTTPRIPQFWSYIAAVAKLPVNPYGQNPHALVL